MTTSRLSHSGKTALFFLLMTFVSVRSIAQSTIGRQKVDQFVYTSWGATTYGLTWLPTDYTTNTTQKYPLIIFLHGKGETGDGINGLYNLLATGLPQTIANGFNPEAVNPADGQNYKFIVVSPQASTATQWSYQWNSIQYILPDIINKYRVDPARIYVTGLSAGGHGAWSCLTSGTAAARKFAAAVPVAGAGVVMDSVPNVGSRDKVKVWQICGDQDPLWAMANSSTLMYNILSPLPPAMLTTITGQGHTAAVWNTAYNPSWRSNIHGKNIYEWMLQYKRTDIGSSPSVPTNQAPTASAGADQSITLPQSSVTLNGTGSDPDGVISNYSWSQVSGPSTALLANANTATALASGLVAGQYLFRLTITDNSGASASATVTITVNAASAPSAPSSSLKIEAENYVSMSGIQTENTLDAGGGLNIGWQDNGDWMDYNLNLASAGTFALNFRVASFFSGAKFQLKKTDGTVLATVTVPNTGSFQSWVTVSAQVTLPAGPQTVRIVTTNANGGWNINWWEIAGAASAPQPAPLPLPLPSPVTSSMKIEAEDYLQMWGIQTENTLDASGGMNVGWQDNGDWMDYSVNLSSAGSYAVHFRVASYYGGSQVQIRNAAGNVIGSFVVPTTGQFQNWTTVSTSLTLPAGLQVLRIYTVEASGGWNINWWEIADAEEGSAPPVTEQPFSSRIEAESYTQMSGIKTEPTLDGGGGLNVGWQDTGDWMDYSVNLAQAAIYTLNFRVASFFNGAQFQLRNSAGTVLTSVTVPYTGSFQNWQTVSVQVPLPAGQQTLRIFTSNANGGWNINWWEITLSPATSGRSVGTMSSQSNPDERPVAIFPNPAADKLVVGIDKEVEGVVRIEIFDLRGIRLAEQSFTKNGKLPFQPVIRIAQLPKGSYLLRVSQGQYVKTARFIKQ